MVARCHRADEDLVRAARSASSTGCPAAAGTAKKGALTADAAFELWYADATQFDLLPHLARCWTPKGGQLAVKTPGKNRKVAAFGALIVVAGAPHLFRFIPV